MTPIIEKVEIFPVAGHDCMELNLSGAHAPYFTRNIVTDSTGAEGVGEVPGGEKITKALEDTKHLVLGTRLVDYKATLLKVRKWLDANIKDDVRGLQTYDLRTGVHQRNEGSVCLIKASFAMPIRLSKYPFKPYCRMQLSSVR